jgi:RNA polymerase sigma-70 factor, ECF subfamily
MDFPVGLAGKRLKKIPALRDHPDMRGASLAEVERLYRGRFGVFLRVATGILRDEERALDAVQDGFAAAVRERRRFRGDGPLEAWVWRLVVNAALKQRRAERGDRLPAAENGAGTAEPAHDLRARIAALPDRQRTVLFLRYFADLDYAAIGEALGISPGTVGATLNAAHAALRRTLEEVPR